MDDWLCPNCKISLYSVTCSDLGKWYQCGLCNKKYDLNKSGKLVKWIPPCPKCKSKEYYTWCGSETWYECVSCNTHFYDDGYKKQLNYDLHKRVLELENKINEIYYAPGMPGYIKANDNYKDNL